MGLSTRLLTSYKSCANVADYAMDFGQRDYVVAPGDLLGRGLALEFMRDQTQQQTSLSYSQRAAGPLDDRRQRLPTHSR
jgi:hypothetical protein